MSTDIVAAQNMVTVTVKGIAIILITMRGMGIVTIQKMARVTGIVMMLRRVAVKAKIKAEVLDREVFVFVPNAEKKYPIKKA